MRRTTICRSRPALVAVAAALLACPVAQAQDTTQVAAAPTLGQTPASHTVVRGETLWSIAQLYFGDPLLWPEIYRLNTTVVEDPHWIYPGEVLALAPGVAVAQGPGEAPVDTAPVVVAQGEPGDTVRAAVDTMAADTMVAAPSDTMMVDTMQAVVAEPPPEPISTYETLFDRQRSTTETVRDVLRAYANQPYRPVRRGEFYASGFLTEEERLPWARVIGTTDQPSIARLRASTTTRRFNEVALTPAANASYHVGDSLLVARLDRTLVRWGDVAVPTGIVRVTEVQEQQILGELITQFGRVRGGQVALPLEPFRDPGEVRPAPIAQGLEARLIAMRDVQPLASTQDFLFIDKGRVDGVVPGDMFQVYRPAAGAPGSPSEEVLAELLVVHTRERTATALLVGVRRGDLTPGMAVRLTRKMPS